MWITIKNFLLDLLFPKFCLGCKKEGCYLCLDCKSILGILEYNYCLCSKNPIRINMASSSRFSGQCSRCKEKNLSGLLFALNYKEKPLTRKLIYQFKYEPYIKGLAKTLSDILIEHFLVSKNNIDNVWQNSVLIPIPLGKSRIKQRGYNQSEELAGEMAKTLNIPVINENLIKIKETFLQTKLGAKERQKNLDGAFLVKSSSGFLGKKVFLIDDVYTTGSTMEECAKVLKEAGAKKVWGIAIAREE